MLRPPIWPSVLAILCLEAALVTGQAPVPSHEPGMPPSAAPPATPPVVASVNGVALLADRLQAAMNELMPYGVYHVGASPERRAALRQQALDKVIDEELQYQDAVRRRLVAPTVDIDKEYARVRRRYRTEAEFRAVLKRAGSSTTDVRREARRRALIRQASERAVTSRCAVTAAEARAFYRANTARFVMPEQLHVFTLTLGVDPSGSADDWAAARKKAEDLLARLRAGADFATMAREHSTDPKKATGGDLGFVHRGRLAEEFEAALADARPGALVGPVQTIYGFHLLHVTAVRPPVQRTFAQVRPTLLKDLGQQRCAEAREVWLRGLRDNARIVIAAPRPPGPSPGTSASPGR